jgi:hypothetical protein
MFFAAKEARRIRAQVRDRMRATQRTEAAQVETSAASGPESRSGEDRTQLRITVYVYNPTKVAATVLEEARQEVVRIYRAAGVEAEWVDCPCVAEELDNYPRCQPNPSKQDWVAVQIISRSMIGGLRLDPSGFGLATPSEEGEFGRRAYVCFQCAEHSVNGRPLLEGRPDARGRILGDLMAHVVGHLVLATVRHSGLGVMRAQWSPKDLEDAAFGRGMFFAAKEARRIRAQVRDRMRAEDAVAMANRRAPQ